MAERQPLVLSERDLRDWIVRWYTWPLRLLAVALLVLLFTLLVRPWVWADQSFLILEGAVEHIVDGDTFDVRSDGELFRIRLCGIDSPERDEPGYQEAAEALARIIGDQSVRCLQVGASTP